MSPVLPLPPTVTVAARNVDVSVLTEDGATVQISLPRPRGLPDLPRDELVAKARRLARLALDRAAETLSQGSVVHGSAS
jgi:hypothetical protein